ncbi:MAG: hypothetical protein ABI740_06445 [Alphaproteobacteria bacterium]
MKRLAIAAIALACSGCVAVNATVTPDQPAASGPETPAILDTVDSFLLAIGNHDYAALKELSVPEGTVYVQRITKGGSYAVMRRSIAELTTPGGAGDPFVERYWSPKVDVRGDLAHVWAPYELRDNGKIVHCGIDAFDLVKIGGAWRVGNLMFTMEPDECGEIKPPSVAAMRPRDGWKEHGAD